MLEKSTKLMNFVKNRNQVLHKFCDIQKELVHDMEMESALELSTIVETFWYLQHTAVSRSIINQLAHQQLASHQILQRRFWDTAAEFLEVTGPLLKLIGVLEVDGCLLSEVYMGFLDLMELCKDDPELSYLVQFCWELRVISI
ncbi:hypothetical protein HDU98_007773 [Podochytrium sp. JEL0797]|nr:hypothetical protein HDU98_007773 [Podochytrium sp. JEL0797]